MYVERNRTRQGLPLCVPQDSGGFTLIELMVVIVIIASLATIVGVNLWGTMSQADVTNAQAQISNFKTALTAYKLTFKKFPTSEQGLEALVSNEKGTNFLDANQIPPDPWGNPYAYTSDDGKTFTIVSYGADGMPGGIDEDADISSENLRGDR